MKSNGDIRLQKRNDNIKNLFKTINDNLIIIPYYCKCQLFSNVFRKNMLTLNLFLLEGIVFSIVGYLNRYSLGVYHGNNNLIERNK